MHTATETDALIDRCTRALAEYNVRCAGLVEDDEPVDEAHLSGLDLEEERDVVRVVLVAAGLIPAE